MNRVFLCALALPPLLSGCATIDEQPTVRLGQATLRLANGQPAGTALLLSSGAQVNISIAVAGLAPGLHGAHLHTVGACDGPEFTSAGAHLNPAGRQHGSANPAGSHFGDLPNVQAGSSGTGTMSATLPGPRAEVLARLFDGDGTAVVIHAALDDYRSDPAGNAGARLACGVLSLP